MASLRTSGPRLWAMRPLFQQAVDVRRSSSKAAKPDFTSILSRPTWSVRSLLPPEPTPPPQTTSPPPTTTTTAATTTTTTTTTPDTTITPSHLHHLLRLSALPLPSSPHDENVMIHTLQSHLHFVRAVQAVDTRGVAPLRSIRDETAAADADQTIGLDQLRYELELERPFGRSGRPRRTKQAVTAAATATATATAHDDEPWDVLQTAPRRAGNYFVVKSRQGT
ncbi:hypothetical protein MAPG_10824 [Magnaporthiopsis poae ATCC 64411]|uniref:Glutamyl-tRNA amidotransferase complex subunit Gta3 domain-containing protein n=1 Tax=Magnaporthiopsis poae (strain ATCC 64411 / 73-15) TaxID=644358 RepID=A0A0C4EDL9_MAGP6|nr:hypothetical protein MAPG_10824 [Magnaporthiopsis poae ATCC 64411]